MVVADIDIPDSGLQPAGRKWNVVNTVDREDFDIV